MHVSKIAVITFYRKYGHLTFTGQGTTCLKVVLGCKVIDTMTSFSTSFISKQVRKEHSRPTYYLSKCCKKRQQKMLQLLQQPTVSEIVWSGSITSLLRTGNLESEKHLSSILLGTAECCHLYHHVVELWFYSFLHI